VANRTLENAQQEMERGNLWRAKEILQGAIGSEKSYDVELFEMMGTVFLRMGDLPEAGRFLFLSGVRKPEYLESIEIFLSRHRRKHPRDFIAHLPRNARLGSLSNYPDDVARVLREIGLPENLKDQNARAYLPQSGKDMIFWITCGTIALVTLVLIILGAMKLLEIIRT
jgi:hypothetical protein